MSRCQLLVEVHDHVGAYEGAWDGEACDDSRRDLELAPSAAMFRSSSRKSRPSDTKSRAMQMLAATLAANCGLHLIHSCCSAWPQAHSDSAVSRHDMLTACSAVYRSAGSNFISILISACNSTVLGVQSSSGLRRGHVMLCWEQQAPWSSFKETCVAVGIARFLENQSSKCTKNYLNAVNTCVLGMGKG